MDFSVNFIWDIIYNNLLFIGHGYTVLKTVVFGLILGIAILAIIKMFKYLDRNPGELFIPVLPYIFLGSASRALVDNAVLPENLFTVTPGIYIIVGFTTIAILLISIFLEKKINLDYRYMFFSTGAILSIPILFSLKEFNITAMFAVFITFGLISLIFYSIRNKWDLLKDKLNLSVLSAHIFDASTTFIAVDFFGYWEQHVLPQALINIVDSSFVMFPLKIIVILLSLYLIDEYLIDDDISKNTVKLAIFILGIAPGLRNLLSLCMGSVI